MSDQKENKFLKKQYEIALSRIEREYQQAENMERVYNENLNEYSESGFVKKRNIICFYTAGLLLFLIITKRYIVQSNIFIRLLPLLAALSTLMLTSNLILHNRESLDYFKKVSNGIDEITAYKESVKRKKTELRLMRLSFEESYDYGFHYILQSEKLVRPENIDWKKEAVGLKTYIQDLLKGELNVAFSIAVFFWGIFLAAAVPGFLINKNLEIFSSYGFDWVCKNINIFNIIVAVLGDIIMFWLVRIYRTAHNKIINHNALLMLLVGVITILGVNIISWFVGWVLSLIINTILPIIVVALLITLVIFLFS